MTTSKEPDGSGREPHVDEGEVSERRGQFAAYVGGEMNEAERAEFELRLERDAFLRREVEQTLDALDAAREWFESETPGSERVEKLETPLVAAPPVLAEVEVVSATRVRGPLAARDDSLGWWLRRGIAAAAIFIAGFFIGQWSGDAAAPADAVTPATMTAEVQSPISDIDAMPSGIETVVPVTNADLVAPAVKSIAPPTETVVPVTDVEEAPRAVPERMDREAAADTPTQVAEATPPRFAGERDGRYRFTGMSMTMIVDPNFDITTASRTP